MLQKVEGIVLRTSSYGETDKIVTIFSRELGKRAAMARGAKKPTSRLSSISQPFTYAYFLIQQGRGMGSLQQGEIIDSMRVIREDIFTTAYASFIMELVDKLIDDESPKPHVFTILQQALEAITEGYDPEAISLFVEWKMLPVAGIYPVLHQCSNCGSTDGEFAFSFAQIGFLCHRCFSIDPYLIRLIPAQVKLIRTFYTVPIDQVGKLSLKKETKGFIKKIVRTIYNEQVGVRLKSQGFLDQMEKTPEFYNNPQKDSSSEE